MKIASFASAWDDVVYTHITGIHETEDELIQDLWSRIIDERYHAADVCTFWYHIFEDNDGLYLDPVQLYELDEDNLSPVCRLVRRLFTREMSATIADMYQQAREEEWTREERHERDMELNDLYEPHLRAVHLTRAELEMIMEQMSESAVCDSIYFTMAIHDI